MGELGMSWMVVLAVGVICAVLAAKIARRKHRDVQEAVALGAFLGPVGLVIVALLPSSPDVPVPPR